MQNKCLACKQELSLDEYSKCHGMHEKCFLQIFELPAFEDFEGVVMKQTGGYSSNTKKQSININDIISSQHSFFQGNFKKYAAVLGGKSYILKVCDKKVAPELPDVEYLSNQIATSLKIPVAWFFLIDFYGVRTFITRNFIAERKGPANLTHIYHYFSSEEQYTCEELIKIIEKQTKTFKDIEIFIHMCLFDALIGNHDRHGKNIALITTSRSCRFSPIYDNPSWLGLETGSMLRAHFSPRGRIATMTTANPNMKDYVEEFIRLGFITSVKRLASQVNQEKIKSIIQHSTCTLLMKEAMINLVTSRIMELKNALLQD